MTDSSPAFPRSDGTIDSLISAMEALGYIVTPPAQALDVQLRNRMVTLASDLAVIDGMTKRGAKLPADYAATLAPMRAYAIRIFDALAAGEPVRNPWDREDKTI